MSLCGGVAKHHMTASAPFLREPSEDEAEIDATQLLHAVN